MMISTLEEDMQREVRNSSGREIHDTPLSRMVREARRKGKRLCSSGGWGGISR